MLNEWVSAQDCVIIFVVFFLRSIQNKRLFYSSFLFRAHYVIFAFGVSFNLKYVQSEKKNEEKLCKSLF